VYDSYNLIVLGLSQNIDSKRRGTLLQIILEAAWYCRLLAIGADGESIPDDRIEKDGEFLCGTPPTAANKLPPCADMNKQRLLNIIQLAPISLIVGSERIKMVRTSGALARDSWSLKEEPDLNTPLNVWRCGAKPLRGLVSNECKFYASAHAAFYYRIHPRVFLLKF
jgi:hypothetical protein